MMDIFDILYLPTISNRKQKFFSDGWGAAKAQVEITRPIIKPLDAIKTIDINWIRQKETRSAIIKQGSFKSIASDLNSLPEECHTCHVELILPREVYSEPTPVVVHFAASGDTGFSRRREILAKPLVKEGIASLILESPYYGLRKPKNQIGTWIRTVKDLLLLGKVSVEEGQSLCVWLHRNGYGPISVSGFSRGGLTASIVASITPLPIGVASLVSCSGGAPVFTEGLIQYACAWDILAKELKLSEKLKEVRPRAHLAKLLNFTHLGEFPMPMKPEAAVFVAARNDGIIPAETSENLTQIWPGSEIRWVNGGHVSSFFFQRKAFREAILSSLERTSSPIKI